MCHFVLKFGKQLIKYFIIFWGKYFVLKILVTNNISEESQFVLATKSQRALELSQSDLNYCTTTEFQDCEIDDEKPNR